MSLCPRRSPDALRALDDIAPMFDELTDLTIQQRRAIKERYRFLLTEYRRRCWIYSYLFYVLRMTMTVGSLAVPALLSIQTNGVNAEIMYWFTWSLSLAVTTANGVMTLFKLDKRFFMLHATAERLRTETWQYLQLSGRYSGHHGGFRPTHANQYVYYCSQIEKIRMKHIEEEFIKQADLADGHPPAPNAARAAPSISNGASVPSPPDQAQLASPPPSRYQRRESESTVGDGENEKEKGVITLSLSEQDSAV